MAQILVEIEERVVPGTVIPKPQAGGDFVVKRWGKRRRDRALVYTIPNHKVPSKPYEKGITNSEWVQAYEHLVADGEFSREWFTNSMPSCAKEGGCNFTTIGGIFQFLGYAEYERGMYRATKSLRR